MEIEKAKELLRQEAGKIGWKVKVSKMLVLEVCICSMDRGERAIMDFQQKDGTVRAVSLAADQRKQVLVL